MEYLIIILVVVILYLRVNVWPGDKKTDLDVIEIESPYKEEDCQESSTQEA
jgi:hypothetical protein